MFKNIVVYVGLFCVFYVFLLTSSPNESVLNWLNKRLPDTFLTKFSAHTCQIMKFTLQKTFLPCHEAEMNTWRQPVAMDTPHLHPPFELSLWSQIGGMQFCQMNQINIFQHVASRPEQPAQTRACILTHVRLRSAPDDRRWCHPHRGSVPGNAVIRVCVCVCVDLPHLLQATEDSCLGVSLEFTSLEQMLLIIKAWSTVNTGTSRSHDTGV